jgi:DNA polymerase III alpha subunit
MENGLSEQKIATEGILEISRLLSIPVVATNNCHYLNREDEEANEVLMFIRSGMNLRNYDQKRYKTGQLYLRSPKEMKRIFSECPQAISNTVHIAEMCNLKIELTDSPPSFGSSNVITFEDCFRDKANSRNKGIISKRSSKIRKEKRNLMFRYCNECYGCDHVARIVSLRKMRRKSALMYVGRAMNIQDVKSLINNINGLDFGNDITNEKIDNLLRLSDYLNGLFVQPSFHTSKIVVSESQLINTTPLCLSQAGEVATQYGIDDLSALGMKIYNLQV